MFWRKGAIAVLLAIVVLSLSADRAEAQGWFGRSWRGWRGIGPWPYGPGQQLAGGRIVGVVPFAGGLQQGTTLTASQWQQLVTSPQQQAPVLSAAQWQQLLAAPGQPPPSALFNFWQQQQLNPLAAAIQRQRQVQPPGTPPRPPADGK